jgi:hypothetical protein
MLYSYSLSKVIDLNKKKNIPFEYTLFTYRFYTARIDMRNNVL